MLESLFVSDEIRLSIFLDTLTRLRITAFYFLPHTNSINHLNSYAFSTCLFQSSCGIRFARSIAVETSSVVYRKRSHAMNALWFARVGLFPMSIILGANMLMGCAIHYYDKDTGAEHIWGIGHMVMKADQPNEGLQAVIHGTDVVGISLGKADKHTYFTIGWHRLEFIDVLKESTSVRLEWPDSTFANVRVGSKFPVTPPLMQPADSPIHSVR